MKKEQTRLQDPLDGKGTALQLFGHQLGGSSHGVMDLAVDGGYGYIELPDGSAHKQRFILSISEAQCRFPPS